MRSLFRATLVLVVLLATASPALAAETSNAEIVIVRPDDVFPDDLYAGAVRVIVQGTLDGDLIAFAAEDVVITGTVTGSVFAVARSVTISGTVEGSVRVSTGRLTVDGDIGGDLVGPTFTGTVTPDGSVGGDLLTWAWSLEALGHVGEDLTGTIRTLSLAGEVDGDVEVTTNRLRVVDPLVVSGDLGYRSDNEIEGVENAQVGGSIVDEQPLPPNLRVRGLWLLGRFIFVLILTAIALTVALGWPDRTARAVDEVGSHPLRNWIKGLGVLASPLLLIGATWLMLALAPATAAFPLLLVLVPLVMLLIFAVLAYALVAGAPVMAYLGKTLLSRLEPFAGITVASLVAGLLWFLPWVGILVPVIVLPLGLGSWMGVRKSPSPEAAG